MKRSYAQLIEESGVETLNDRRRGLTDNFVKKTVANPKFREEWFPTKEFEHYDLRRKKYSLRIMPGQNDLIEARFIHTDED